MPVTELTSAAEVLVATAHDAYARSTMRQPVLRGWLLTDTLRGPVPEGTATAWVGMDSHDDSPYLMALGHPARVAALLTELLPELQAEQNVTLPRGTGALLPAWVGLAGIDWDFRWIERPPPWRSGEDRVVEVDDDDAVGALLAAASPRASVQPGSRRARSWVGIPGQDGDLLACAADTSQTPGVGHMSSIAVAPEARGQGFGATVTAALTRRLLVQGYQLVTLGMYADNVPGRALYDALGYADDHRFTSGPLVVRSRW